MPSRVYAVILFLAFISEKCNSLRAVTEVEDKFQSDLDLKLDQFIEPLKPYKEYDVRIPEDVEDIKLINNYAVTREGFGKYEGHGNQPPKQRRTRQTHHGYKPLYPQVPSAPPYNSYQPNYDPSGQNSAYNPPRHPQYPQQWNPNLVNNNHSGYPSPQSFNNHSSLPYNPAPGPYGQNPGYGRPPQYNGQYPINTASHPPYAGFGYRPPNSTFHSFSQGPPSYNPGHNIHPVLPFNSTSQQPPYNPAQYPSNNNTRPNYTPQWPSSGNTSYPGVLNNRPSYNSSHGQYPQYPNSYPQYPTHSRNSTFNITSQRPPYYPGANGQYPTPNQHYPIPHGQYPSSGGGYPTTYGQFPTPTGQFPTQNGQYPSPNNQYPTPNGQYPTPNGQYHPPNGQYPNPTGQYPRANGQFQGSNFGPNYPSSNTTTGYKFSNTYSPSIPSSPPHNNDQNLLYYPQRNTTEYDPRKTPQEQLSYHH